MKLGEIVREMAMGVLKCCLSLNTVINSDELIDNYDVQ